MRLILIATIVAALGALATFVVGSYIASPKEARTIWQRRVYRSHDMDIYPRPGGGVVAASAYRITFFDDAGNRQEVYEPKENWFSNSIADGDGNLYIGGSCGWVYALDSEGNERWKTQLPNQSHLRGREDRRKALVALSTTGDLLVHTNWGEIALLDRAGSIRDRAAVNLKLTDCCGSLLLPGNKVVTIANPGGPYIRACAIGFDGKVEWTFSAPGGRWAMVFLLDDVIVLNPGKDRIYGLDFEGNELWSFRNPDPVPHNGSHYYEVFPRSATSVLVMSGKNMFEIGKDGLVQWWIKGNYYGSLQRVSDDSFYAIRWVENPSIRLYINVARHAGPLHKFSTRPMSGSELVLFRNRKEVDVMKLPPESQQLCQTADGRLYCLAWNVEMGEFISRLCTIHCLEL